jgi:hypothetical protein
LTNKIVTFRNKIAHHFQQQIIATKKACSSNRPAHSNNKSAYSSNKIDYSSNKIDYSSNKMDYFSVCLTFRAQWLLESTGANCARSTDGVTGVTIKALATRVIAISAVGSV